MTSIRIDWSGAFRHWLQVQAFCLVIAAVTTLIWPRLGYLDQLVYASLIGVSTWLVIEFGRYVVAPEHCHVGHHGSPGWPKGWRGIVLITVGIAAGFVVGSTLANLLMNRPSDTGRDVLTSLLISAIASVAISFFFHARGKAAELAAKVARTERDAAEAQLKLLETQLEPHMLFNTLANLRVLITLDPSRAVAMLDRLDDYLRATLAGSRATQHALAQEFARLNDYLELMTVRMGERLRYQLDLPADLRDVPVPPLLLQPLVENAIRHGLEPKVGGGRIQVSARRASGPDGNRLVLEVVDTGVGLPPEVDTAPQPRGGGGGFGLQQVRQRLLTLHGERGALDLIAVPSGGTRVTVTFPL